MMKTDAGTCASLSISWLTTSFRLSNHFLLYTPIDLRFQLYQQSNQTSHSDQPKIYPTVFWILHFLLCYFYVRYLLSKHAFLYNHSSKYYVQMCKKLQLFCPQTTCRGCAPGPHWGTSVPEPHDWPMFILGLIKITFTYSSSKTQLLKHFKVTVNNSFQVFLGLSLGWTPSTL